MKSKKKKEQPDKNQLELFCSYQTPEDEEHTLYLDQAGQFWIDVPSYEHKKHLQPVTELEAVKDWVGGSAPEGWRDELVRVIEHWPKACVAAKSAASQTVKVDARFEKIQRPGQWN